MRLAVLGRIEAIADAAVPLASKRQRALLAVLACRLGEVCSVESLVDAIWEEDTPPLNGRAAVHTLVSRLRAAIDAAGGDGGVVEWVDGLGYRLDRECVHLDADEAGALFRDADALRRSGASDLAGAGLERALELFRGEPYAEFAHCEWARPDATRLAELRADMIEAATELMVDRGDHRSAIERLDDAISLYPYRERLRATHMTALYRSGRHSDALASYQAYRRTLADELGLDPSLALRELEHRILGHDPMLDVPVAGRPLRGYRLLECLGSDELGERWRATQPGVARAVVVTVVDATTVLGARLVADFVTGASRLGRLSIEHIPDLVDAWRDGSGAYLVTRPPQGTCLADEGVDSGARLIGQIAEAVRHAHGAGVAHGQLSAAFVYTDANRVVVTGWGVPADDDLIAQDLAALEDLARSCGVPPVSGAPARSNPYRGLAPFDVDDGSRFFGREREVDLLLAATTATRFVTVVGASGTGKSSLVRAGLLARVVDRPYAIVTPAGQGRLPLAAVMAAARGVGTAAPVLVIDQLEEAFVQLDGDARSRFLSELVAIAAQGHGSMVATLRADQLDAALSDPMLGPLVQEGLVPLGPMSAAGLREAIVRPAALVGLTVDEDLTAELLSTVAARPDALPLLQFCLTELVDAAPESGDRLSLEGYRHLGGMEATIARSAEVAYGALSGQARDRARAVLCRLASLDGGVGNRRTVSIAELTGGGADDAAREVVDSFRAARLVVTGSDPVTREQFVSITHEALVTQWPRLARWLDEDRAALDDLLPAQRSIKGWIESGRHTDLLLRGVALARAATVAEARPELLSAEEHRFVSESERFAQRAQRRQRRVLVVVSVLAVMAVVGAGLALVQRQQARVSARDERAARRDSDLTTLAFEAERLASGPTDLALLLAAEAWRRRPDATSESALLTALAARAGIRRYVAVVAGDGAPIDALALAGSVVAIRYGTTVELRDVARLGDQGPVIEVDQGAAVSVAPDGSTLVVASDTGLVERHSTRTGAPTGDTVLLATSGAPARISHLADGNLVASQGAEVVMIGANGIERRVEVGHPVVALAAHPSLRRVLAATTVGVSQIDLDSGVAEPLIGARSTSTLAYSADGSHIWMVASQGQTAGTLFEFDAVTLEVTRDLLFPSRHAARISELGDGRLLVATDTGTGLLLDPTWKARTPVELGISSPVVLADGTLLGAAGRQLGVVDVDAVSPLAGRLSPAVTGLGSIDPRSGQLVHAVDDQYVHVDVRQGGIRPLPVGPVDGVPVLAPGGEVVALRGGVLSTLFVSTSTGERLSSPLVSSGALPAFAPGGDLVAVSEPSGVVVRQVPSMEPVTAVAPVASGDEVTDLSWSPDATQLAITTASSPTRVVSPSTGLVLGLLGAIETGTQIRWSNDGTRVALLTPSGSSRVLDARTGSTVASLRGLSAPIELAGWARADSRLVVVRGSDSGQAVIEMFDSASGQQIGVPLGFAPLGAVVPGIGLVDDDRVVVFAVGLPARSVSLDPNDWADTVCRIVGRDLTPTEWATHLAELGDPRPTCPMGS